MPAAGKFPCLSFCSCASFFLTSAQTADIGTMRPEYHDREYGGQRQQIDAAEQRIESQQRGDKSEGAQ